MTTNGHRPEKNLTLEHEGSFFICTRKGNRVVAIVVGRGQTAREVFSSDHPLTIEEKLNATAAVARVWMDPQQQEEIERFIAQL